MFIVALLIGGYAYIILLLGLLRQLSFPPIFISTVIFLILTIFIIWKNRQHFIFKIKTCSKTEKLLGIILILFFLIHFIGALTPEIYFDALWYHLTLPRIYLWDDSIHFIPGNLYYYSAMPQLIELLYIPALLFGNEITAKVIHYLFAILTTLVIVKIGSRFASFKIGLVAGLIFISDLSVAWLASTAYIDLGRTFFETVSLYYLISWWQDKKKQDLLKSGLILGLAISSKYFALATLSLGLGFVLLNSSKDKLKNILVFCLPAFFVSGFWFVYAYLYTGNPIYPIFTPNLDSSHQSQIGGLYNFAKQFYNLSNDPHDWLSPISPLYLMYLPLIIYIALRNKKIKTWVLYALGTIIIWYLIPRTGGSRFMVPYLPLFALLVSFSVFNLKQKSIRKISIFILFSVILFNLTVRMYVNKKTVPLLLGLQTKQEYLIQNLDFSNAFYDIENKLPSLIDKSEPILIIGGHNLFYFPSIFIHESYYQGQSVNYILTQYKNLPVQYQTDFKLIYQNEKTFSKLYQRKNAN